jgi:hypothetical protein
MYSEVDHTLYVSRLNDSCFSAETSSQGWTLTVHGFVHLVDDPVVHTLNSAAIRHRYDHRCGKSVEYGENGPNKTEKSE